MTPARRWGRRLAAGALAVTGLLISLPGAPFASHAGAEDPPYTVTVTPADDLGDGQVIDVTIKGTADFPVTEAEMRICRLGVDYQTAKGARPNNDAFPGGPNCPNKPVSSSANLNVIDTGVSQNATTAAGSINKYRVGTGSIAWDDPTAPDNHYTLQCDADNPCALVVEIRAGAKGAPSQWTPVVRELHFKTDDPVAGCGGPAQGLLQSGGSDRIKDAWVDWTLDECKQPGRSGGASRAVFNGEGSAVEAFAKGTLDLAYTALGFNPDAGLLPEDVSPRPVIAVPMALNAAVLGVAGGRRTDSGTKVPYEDLKLTLAEVAGLFSAGDQGISPHFPDVFARNPELNENFFDSGSNIAGFLVAAPADAESTSWVFTNDLLRTVPDAWRVPNTAQFGDDAGRARGADASLALADPTFAGTGVTTLSGRPPLANGLAKLDLSKLTQGGVWVLSDLETVRALGMTTAKIGNVAGEFVPITKESVQAGVASMREGDDGMLVPDPKAVDKVDGVTPYPMTMVEYALVPAEPLLDKTCATRPASQALLAKWLQYVTGPGQGLLPDGMFPLTPELQEQAAARIASIGKAETTGACEGKVHAGASDDTDGGTTGGTSGGSTGGTTGGTDGGSTGGTDGGSTSGSTGGSSVRRSSSSSNALTNTPVAAAPSDGGGDTVELAASVPNFAGRSSVGWFGTILALAGITGLSGLTALLGTGRGPELAATFRRRWRASAPNGSPPPPPQMYVPAMAPSPPPPPPPPPPGP